MVELKVISYKPRLKASVFALIFATLFLAMTYKLSADIPIVWRVFVVLISLIVIFATLWNLTKGRRVSKAMKEFARSLRVENEVLKLPKTMKVRKARVEIRKDEPDESASIILHNEGEELELDEIPLSPSEYGAIVGIAYPELIRFACYEIEEFKTISGSLVICPIKKKDYEILLEKSSLFISEKGDQASVDLKVKNNTIEGRLTYLKGNSRSARVEIEADYKAPLLKYPRKVLRGEIVKTNESGTFEFEYEFTKVDDMFIIFFTGDVRITPRSILKILGFNAPVVFGNGWENLDVKIKLVLDYTAKPDKVDETKISVRLTQSSPFNQQKVV